MSPSDLYNVICSRASAFNLENLMLGMSMCDQKFMETLEKLSGVLDANWDLNNTL